MDRWGGACSFIIKQGGKTKGNILSSLTQFFFFSIVDFLGFNFDF